MDLRARIEAARTARDELQDGIRERIREIGVAEAASRLGISTQACYGFLSERGYPNISRLIRNAELLEKPSQIKKKTARAVSIK